MTTIINSPPTSNTTSSSIVIIFGLIAMVVLAYLFIVFGLPQIRNMVSPQITIPNSIDVNIKQTK